MTEFDYAKAITDTVMEQKRPPDGCLHPSGDILGPLRHAQLRIAGAPMKPEPLSSANRLTTGILWHRMIAERMERQKMHCIVEKPATEGLPIGWSGTPDLVARRPSSKTWRLYDSKTQRVEAFAYDGGKIKPEHQWQCTSYVHAFGAMGYDMDLEYEVAYIPLNAGTGKYQDLIVEVRTGLVIDRDEWQTRLGGIALQTEAFLTEVGRESLFGLDMARYPTGIRALPEPTEAILKASTLAPPPEREQRIYKERDGTQTVKLVPTWYSSICPFDEPWCSCSTMGTTKIGTLTQIGDRYLYEPRSGYNVPLDPNLVDPQEMIAI